MKKYLFTLLALVAFLPFAATAQLRVDVDNIDNVEFDLNGTAPSFSLEDGKYLIEMNGERNLRIIAKKDVLFTEVTMVDDWYQEENDWSNRVDILADGRYCVDLYSSFPEDEWFRIRTSASTDARSAACTVNIDEPSRVLLKRKGEVVDLVPGANTVKFDRNTEAEIEIEPVGKPLYRVTKGDTEIKTDYRYIIPVTDGDVINIEANYPDTPCAVKFVLIGNGASDFITEVDVDGRPEFNWRDKDFTVKCGTELKLKGNTNEYEVLSFTINGKSAMFSNPTTILITEDADLIFQVRKYASFLMTINVDDPSHVTAYRGHVGNNDPFVLEAGDNVVEVTRNTPIVSFVPAEGYYIETLVVNDDEYADDELNVIPVRVGMLTDDDVIALTTKAIVRDLKAMIYIENLEASADYFTLKRSDLSVVEGLHEGYNELAFYTRDNLFRFETGGPVDAHFYVNGQVQEPAPGGFTYTPELTDGDVVKVYFGDEPATHTVTFNVPESLVDGVNVVTDHTTPVSALSDLSVLHNSHIMISLPKDADATVRLDNKALEPDAKGTYSFAAVNDHVVHIDASSTGIEDVTAPAADARVYNLQGIPVATSDQPLPAGVYIIGGKKVMIK